MITIPEQLKNLSFVKLPRKSKKPFEPNWQNNPYSFEQIQNWLKQGNQYGILCGTKTNDGYLITIDADHPDLANYAQNNLDLTFTVKTPKKGYHFLYYIDEPIKKVVLKKNNVQYGEIQSIGTQIVGAGSLHPDVDGTYEVKEDLPIEKISLEKLYSLIKTFSGDTKRGLEEDDGSDDGFELPNRITLGTRDDTFTRYVASLVTQGFRDDEIEELVKKTFEERCDKSSRDPFDPMRKIKGWISSARKKFNQPKPAEKRGEGDKNFEILSALSLKNEHHILYCTNRFFKYENGFYAPYEEEPIKELIIKRFENNLKKNWMLNIYDFLKIKCFIQPNELNNTHFLNLRNGLFDPVSKTMHPHTPKVYSTVRLPITWNPNAKAELWLKTINEIFQEDTEKIELLQEFMGLCFTKITKFQKAMFFIGEGANGKSVILDTLENLLGNENTSAVSVDNLDNSYYTSMMFGKLANISNESSVNANVFESVFKNVADGKEINSNAKYERLFKFKPFCKLLFAINNLPRVDDKTDSYFRRLLILEFNRQFNDEEQNPNLVEDLKPESDGIFLWCIEGLQRLLKRRYFKNIQSSKDAINKYKMENNSVMCFVEESCEFHFEFEISKNELYQKYKDWCIEGGFRNMSKNKFSREVHRHYKDRVSDAFNALGDTRIWHGLQMREEFKLGRTNDDYRPF